MAGLPLSVERDPANQSTTGALSSWTRRTASRVCANTAPRGGAARCLLLRTLTPSLMLLFRLRFRTRFVRSVERRAWVFCERATTLGLTTSFGPPLQITRRFKGTSGAAALVAGVAALVISANNDLTAAQVCDVLERTASKDLDLEGGTPTITWKVIVACLPFESSPSTHSTTSNGRREVRAATMPSLPRSLTTHCRYS